MSTISPLKIQASCLATESRSYDFYPLLLGRKFIFSASFWDKMPFLPHIDGSKLIFSPSLLWRKSILPPGYWDKSSVLPLFIGTFLFDFRCFFFLKLSKIFFVFLFISSRYFHGNRKCQNELTGSSWRSWVKKEKVLVMFTDWSHFRPNWGLGNRWRKMSTAHKHGSPRRSINSERTANRENWPPCETILSHSKINFIVNLPKVFQVLLKYQKI